MTSPAEHIASLERKVGPQARSPLFARLASLYLETDRAADALKICDAGLANFPFYTTGHLVKAKALVVLQMPTEARRHYEIVLDFLPGNATVKELLASVPLAPEETLAESVFETPPEEPKAKKRFEDMFQTIPSGRKEPVVEPVVPPPPVPVSPVPPAIVEEPRQEQLPDEGFGGSVEVPPVEDFGAEPQAASDTYAFEQPPTETVEAEPPAPAAERAPAPEDMFGGISGFTPDASEGERPAYVEPGMPSGVMLFGDVPSVAPPAKAYGVSSSSAEREEVPFDGLGLPDAPIVDEPPIPVRAAEPEVSPGDMILFAGPMDGDTYEKFSLRLRAEMSGENSMTLVDYLSGVAPKPSSVMVQAEAAFKKDRIEEIAERLHDVKKITPVINFTQKGTVAASEEDTPASTGFVTPTLAEIYAKQGWYDDAIKAYKTLVATKPAEKERFEKRIIELEEMKRQAGG